MERVELLTVEGTSRFGDFLMLRPDFSIPDGWERRGWAERIQSVLIQKPDGDQLEASAHISMTHLNIRDPDVPTDMRWRLKVWFKDKADGDVPIGSKILVSKEVRDAILPDDAA